MIISVSCSPKFYPVNVMYALRTMNANIQNVTQQTPSMLVTVSTKMSKDVSLQIYHKTVWRKKKNTERLLLKVRDAILQNNLCFKTIMLLRLLPQGSS